MFNSLCHNATFYNNLPHFVIKFLNAICHSVSPRTFFRPGGTHRKNPKQTRREIQQ